MRRKVDQIAAIDEGNYFYTRRQNAVVQLLNLRVDSSEGVVRIGAFAQEHDSGNHIVVIDNFAIVVANCPRKLAKPDLRALPDYGDIPYMQRCAILGGNGYVLYIPDVPYLA